MTRKYDPSKDRAILDDVCKSTNLPSFAAMHAAFLKCGLEWPVLWPMWGRPSKYARLVDDEIMKAWARRGWVH